MQAEQNKVDHERNVTNGEAELRNTSNSVMDQEEIRPNLSVGNKVSPVDGSADPDTISLSLNVNSAAPGTPPYPPPQSKGESTPRARMQVDSVPEA